MIYLEDKHHKIIQKILNKYPYDFYAFGSRVKGTHKSLSDLDLCLLTSIPILEKAQLQEDFDESDLPFKVDLIQWDDISEDFRQIIKPDLIQFA